MATPTPEERYAATFREWALDDQKRHDEHFTKAIRDAEAAARAKAFNEVDAILVECMSEFVWLRDKIRARGAAQ